MASVIYCGAFDLAEYGSVSIDWTDASGAHSVSLTTGVYVHGSVAATLYTATTHATLAAILNFTTVLVAAMDAATAQTVTGGFDQTTGLVTLACTGGTFTISFVGAAGDRMKALIGFTGTITGATGYTGPSRPVYVLGPSKPCVSAYEQPAKEPGRTSTKRTGDGSMYTLRPLTIVSVTSWRHDFEPKAMIDRVYYDGGHSADAAPNVYTWEDLWDDYGDHRLPIFAIWYGSGSNIEMLAFDLLVDSYDKTTHGRMNPRDDVRFKVMISASLRARVVV